MTPTRDTLRIHLLGGFALAFDGDQLPPLPSRQARLLFAWLGLQSGRPQSRTLLADRFWPDLPEARGRRRLSHALWQIQDSMGEIAAGGSYVLTRGDEVAFDADAPSWLDAHEFEQRLDAVDSSGAGIDAGGVRLLRRALQLYGGDLLAGNYEPWVLQEQERLRQRYVFALQRLATACEQRGNFDEALAVARRLTHEAPLREDAHRSVMRLCVLVGQPSQALEQFERCRSVLEEELGTRPSAETMQLHDSIAHSRTISPARSSSPSRLETHALVGRDDERVRLVDQLERTLAGAAGAVFVEGEQGVGKSHLLVQIAEDARWRGFTVVWGTCAERRAPFSWLRDALLPVLDKVRVTQLAAVVAPVWLHDAARLLPPLRDGLDRDARRRPPLAGADGAERMRQALTHVLTGLATVDPLMLVLEDVHAADEDTLALLRTLARHPTPGRLLTMVSFRDVEARSDVDVWSSLRTLDRDARPVRLTLRPMSPFETGAVLREALRTQHVPSGFVERVHRETGGNPLYIIELLRALRDEGELADSTEEHLDSLAVPFTHGVGTLIGNRLALLDDSTAAVAQQAAVLGAEFRLPVLASACDVPERDRTVAVGELVRRNLLQVDDDGARFTHAATRKVLLGELSEEREIELHAAAARALELLEPDDVESLAEHLLVAAPPRAVRPLRVAADRALALHAYGRAAEHLLAAVDVARRLPMGAEDRVEMLLNAESVLDVLGRRPEQAVVLDQLDELGTDDPRLTVERGLRRATYLGHLDRLVEAVEAATSAVDAAPATEPLLRGRALTALGHIHSWAGDNARAVEVLDLATPLVAADPAATADAAHALGTSLRLLQRFDEARAALDRARTAAEETEDDAALVKALGGLADVDAETGRTAEAADLHERAVTLARRIGFRYREGVSLVNLATIRLMRAEPAFAREAFDEAGKVFAALGNARGAAMVQLNRAWLLHRWLGDDIAATADAHAARDHFEGIGNAGFTAIALETLAGVARRTREFSGARALLDSGLAAADAGGDRRATVQLLRGHVELALAAGDPTTALGLAEDALTRARDLELPEFVADLASLAARASVRVGDVDLAAELAAEAGARLATSTEPHRIHHRLGLVADALGQDQAAADHHRAADSALREALRGLPEDLHTSAAAGVREHAAIVALGREHAPRLVELRLARMDAPRGRALAQAETVSIELELPARMVDPEARRRQLLRLLRQVHGAGALATVEDLSTMLDVSTSTVHRDLRALRSAGHEPVTRGTGTG